jgi:hypothetical protein
MRKDGRDYLNLCNRPLGSLPHGSALILFTIITCLVFCIGASANAVPHVDQPLVPASTLPGGPAFTLVVSGAGFNSGSVVNWNGSPRATTFISSSKLTAPIEASDIAIAGTPWVTVVNPAPGGGKSNTVFFQVMRPQPNADFQPHTCKGTPQTTGDFDGDGLLDMVTYNYTYGASGTLSILLGNSKGTFTVAKTYGVSGYYSQDSPNAIVAGDFNGDAKLDLALIAGEGVTIWMGNGDGSFYLGTPIVTTFYPTGVVAGDFNEDGNLDLIVGNSSNGNSRAVSLFLGNGDGTFQPEITVSSGIATGGMAIGDFNGDGHLDFAVSGYGISVVLGNGNGTFQPYVENYNVVGDYMAVGDLNGDGLLDVVFNGSQVMLGTGGGALADPISYDSPGVGVVLGDFNGDGILDMATSNESTVYVLNGKGDGTFEAGVASPSYYGKWTLVSGDFDGDGKLDLDNGCEDLQVPIAIHLSNSKLQFTSQQVGTTSPPKNVQVTNTGNLPATISSITIVGEFGETSNCPATLAVFQRCTISVTFTPTGKGSAGGELYVNAVSSPQMVELIGVGTN